MLPALRQDYRSRCILLWSFHTSKLLRHWCRQSSLSNYYANKNKSIQNWSFPPGSIGKTNNALHPITTLLNYLSIRGNTPGLIFHFEDHTPLTKSKFTSEFRCLLNQASIDSTSYAGHSFRVGAASTAASAGTAAVEQGASPPVIYPKLQTIDSLLGVT